jgi:membrane protease YdiL (CAAX protease family)
LHWDFALILGALGIVVPVMGRRRVRVLLQLPDTTKLDRLSLYASTIAFQWLSVALILWRTARHGIHPGQLGLSPAFNRISITITVVLSGLFFVLQIVSSLRLRAGMQEFSNETVQLALKVFPRDGVERLSFFALVSTVAICEEFIYRGFAQYVLQDWSHSLFFGLVLSSLLFSVAHLYQGRRGLVSTFTVGILFAGVRAWSGTLLPTIVAHFVADFTIGLLAPRHIREALARSTDDENIAQNERRLVGVTSKTTRG